MRTPNRFILMIVAAPAAVWLIAAALFALRWNLVYRTIPPRELFPYDEMRVGVDASYPPFATATQTDLFGLDIDLARAIGMELNIPVRFVNLGFDGLYDALYTDQVDVLISALPMDMARQDRVIYSRPYFNAGLVLVTKTDGSPLFTIEQLAGHRLAYEFGSLAHSEADQWARRILPFEARPYELHTHALDAVRLGEADAAIVDSVAAGEYRQQHPDWSSQQSHVTDLLFAVAIRIDRPQQAAAIDHALNVLFEHGEIEAIIARWL
jgi:polar amino acid transport system substrate-binding protein